MLVYTSCIQDLDWTLGGGGGCAYVSLYKLYTGHGLDYGVVLMLVYTSCIQDLDWTLGGGGVLMLVYTSCIQDLDWTLGWCLC